MEISRLHLPPQPLQLQRQDKRQLPLFLGSRPEIPHATGRSNTSVPRMDQKQIWSCAPAISIISASAGRKDSIRSPETPLRFTNIRGTRDPTNLTAPIAL